MARHRRVNMTERWGVTAYYPPKHIEDIASDRIGGIVAAFVAKGARADQLMQLARSCYMQGLNDMTDAVIKSGQFVEKRGEGK